MPVEEGFGLLGLHHQHAMQLTVVLQRDAQVALETLLAGARHMEVVGVVLDHPGHHRQAGAGHFAGEALVIAQLLADHALVQAAGGDDLQALPVRMGEVEAADVHVQLAPHGVHALVHGVGVFSHARAEAIAVPSLKLLKILKFAGYLMEHALTPLH